MQFQVEPLAEDVADHVAESARRLHLEFFHYRVLRCHRRREADGQYQRRARGR